MNARLLAWTATLSMAAIAPFALSGAEHSTAFDAGELRVLRAADDGSLDELRAGLLETPAPLADVERAGLLAASQAGLEDLRGGDIHLTDREVKLMLIAAGVVLVVALLV